MDRQLLVRKFDKQAKKYKKRQENGHANKFRQRIFHEAKGKVLEVAIGSGLNFPFYSRDIELTGLDFSHEMLKAAQNAAKDYPFKTTLIQEDVETVEFNENSFDTIVSSASLCAYQEPVTVLNSFQKWCKPEGKILMMEHGISTNKLLAGMQKSLDPLALKVVGCHQNRDISDIVKRSDLTLVREERYLAGYLYLIWAKS
ncbi:ubiquinone/menaquinone biosynthesis C-methylase UbiE [Virgibacillus halotolerans]|uniref:class I SAM-dependent methyltransferase n=1 Tax=Virgibacillus halotolerans TaxID=1071053 RepID=UPI0019620D17|nr:class I SAM-dependent methyltransferase [Virgibacillus halotolerans]MBM7599488.1 ubiquinone/menaquinone biosynthesis C-methylase UbiE [Virgibacillus halotolerans]